MAVKTWVGRFAIVDGQAEEEGPYLRSFPRQRPDDDEDELYVLVDPTGAGSDEHAPQLADAIGRVYRQDTLSITGGLLRSLRAAHQQLRDWNQRSLPEHQVTAGVGCLAVQRRTAYLAQVGPSVAYHVGDGRLRRIVPEDAAAEPVGRPERIEPAITRFQLSPGDLLLLAPSKIDELIDEAAMRSLLLRGADGALKELFRLAREEREFSLILLACVVEPELESAPESSDAAGQGPALEEPQLSSDADETGGPAAAPEPPPLEPAVAGAPPPGLEQPKLRLKGAEASIRYPRTTGRRSRLPSVPPVVLVAAVALAVIGVLAFLLIPDALQESRDERFGDLVAAARDDLNAAEAADDPGLRRSLLEDADAGLADAEGLSPNDPEVASLRTDVLAALTELNAVVELATPELIVNVSEQVTGAVSLSGLTLGGGGAYFLDREQGRVIALALLAANPAPFLLLQTGGAVGSVTAGTPQHIAWADELGALLILDDARRLISITPGQPPRLLPLRGADAWGSADGIAFASGFLYVLDRASNQVWRYRPTETGFDSEREALLTALDLEKAVDIAVEDALYVVMDDGTVASARFGVEEVYSQAGIDRPLVSPASPAPLPATGRLLVADRSNERIVVFSLDGLFLQQWVSPATLADLRAVAVDDVNGVLYLLAGDALYRTTLPPP